MQKIWVCQVTMYCMAGTLMSLSWMPAVVNSVVKTKGWLVITMSPGRIGEVLNKTLSLLELTRASTSVKKKVAQKICH